MVRIVGMDDPKTIKHPKGYSPRQGYKKIAVNFKTDNFDKVLAKAKQDKKSFSMVVDEIVSRHFVNIELARMVREREQA